MYRHTVGLDFLERLALRRRLSSHVEAKEVRLPLRQLIVATGMDLLLTRKSAKLDR